MHEELIVKAREICKDATPGPWYADGWAIWDDEVEEFRALHDTNPDAAFIAASRNLVPDLADALEQAQPKWIPVTERLPIANKNVLLFLQEGFVKAQVIGRLEATGPLNGEFTDVSGERVWRKECVKAWMWLPAPSKGE